MWKIPEIGLGTWDLRGSECTKAVKHALEMGYRHIDTAHVYENHGAIAKGIAGFDRHELFITSKISLENQLDPKHVEQSVEKACDLALKELKTDYLDLYLIHWPDAGLPIAAAFKTMEYLIDKGKINKAGVSNFTIHHLEDFRKEGCWPAANQVEFHPYLYQKDLLEYCKAHKIQLVAYRPFGKGKLLGEPLLGKIGEAHGKTGAQVVLRWLIQHGIPAIPKASSEEHMRANLAIFDFKLSDAEMQQLNALNRNERFCMPEHPAFNY